MAAAVMPFSVYETSNMIAPCNNFSSNELKQNFCTFSGPKCFMLHIVIVKDPGKKQKQKQKKHIKTNKKTHTFSRPLDKPSIPPKWSCQTMLDLNAGTGLGC